MFALAQARGGSLSVLDVAQVLGLSEVETDRYLTDLAKQNPERVRLEIDPSGTLVYQFPQYMLSAAPSGSAGAATEYAALDDEAAAPNAARRVR